MHVKRNHWLPLLLLVIGIALFYRYQPLAEMIAPTLIMDIQKAPPGDDGGEIFELQIFRAPALRFEAHYGVLPMWGEAELTTEKGSLSPAQLESVLQALKAVSTGKPWGQLSVVGDLGIPSRGLDESDWSALETTWVGQVRQRLEKRNGRAPSL